MPCQHPPSVKLGYAQSQANRKPNQKPIALQKQRGLATILIILIVGISMMALSMSAVRNVKSTQQKQVAVHATAHVQPLVWTGVEVFRAYLEELSEEQLSALKPSSKKMAIALSSISADNASLSVTLLEAPTVIAEGEFEYYQVPVAITAFDYHADASASVKAVYYVAPPGGNNCVECVKLSATLDFHDNLDIEGGITVAPAAGTQTTFNVDGDVTALHVSLTSINYLNSTGDITLSSGTFIDELVANGSISLSGAAGASKLFALGNVTLDAGIQVDEIKTNSDVVLKSASRAKTSIDALGTIYNASIANQGLATVGGDILISGTAGSMKQAFAVGNVDIAYANTSIPHIKTQGNVACPGVLWHSFTSIYAQGSTINCPPNTVAGQGTPASTYEIQDNTPVTIKLMNPLGTFEMPKPIINVWTLKGYANYIFTREGTTTKVLVKNVNGIEDGNYYVADYPQKPERYHRDYLCKEIDDAGQCSSPASASETKTICYGHSANDGCLSYDDSSEKWLFNGKSFAPGVMWFEGNLELGNGIYYNTFLATGDVDTAGGLKTSSPNFSGYSAICELNYPENKNELGDFDGLYPTNLCNIADSKMIYNAIGNIAIIAGGTPPGESSYSGGNVYLGSSNTINGTILAGEHLITNGSSVIRGYVTATSQSGKGKDGIKNSIGGSTSILLDDLPDGYYPPTTPPMIPKDPDDNTGGKGFSKIIWARYL